MRAHPVIALAFATTLLAEGCATATADSSHVPLSPVAVRETQTRFLDHVDSTRAMKVLIDTLQDGQFTIDRADAALGLIVGTRTTAQRASTGETVLKWTTICFTYGLSALLPWTKNQTTQIEASANVTPAGDGSRVRITFNRRILDSKGRIKRGEPITDPALYQDIFELMGRSLFIAEGQ